MNKLAVRLVVLCVMAAAFARARAEGKSTSADPAPISKEQVAGTWATAGAPDKDGRFFFCQRTFDKDGTIKGFISCRQLTDKPKYKEVGRILVIGKWSFSGNKLTTQVLRCLPPHDELPSGEQVWTIEKLTQDAMVLVLNEKQVTLTKATPGDDPNRTGSDQVQFYTEKVPDMGL